MNYSKLSLLSTIVITCQAILLVIIAYEFVAIPVMAESLTNAAARGESEVNEILFRSKLVSSIHKGSDLFRSDMVWTAHLARWTTEK